MREIVFDTETTGLDPSQGHRLVQIGAVELIDFLPTGREYMTLINPMRPMDPGAAAVHGITDAMLEGQPIFDAVIDDFLAFVDGANLVAHNADFDMKFLNFELKKSSVPCSRKRALSIRWKSPDAAFRGKNCLWMRCASGWAWIIPCENTMMLCSIVRYWQKFIWNYAADGNMALAFRRVGAPRKIWPQTAPLSISRSGAIPAPMPPMRRNWRLIRPLSSA